jgi:tetratricopeptide (TPR) repeat protein
MKLPHPIAFVCGMVLLAICNSSAAAGVKLQNRMWDSAYKKVILQQIEKLIAAKYVLAEKARNYSKEFRKKYLAGAYASITDAKEFADKVTADLQNITHDRHVSLRKIDASDIGERAAGALHHPVRLHRLRLKENSGFHKLEWINGHIGYLDLRRFWAFESAREMVLAAMKFLENADAIIIDVRENGGGSGTHLSSFFLPYPTQLTGWYYREQNYTEEFRTFRELEGRTLVDVPLFLLVGKDTFSAAEIFAYDLQARNRALLIGEPTKGGAHSIDLFKIDDQFEIIISTSRAINPVTGTNWEGTGVIPDVAVAPERALATAIELAEKAGSEFTKARDEKLKKSVDAMQAQLDLAERYFRENNATAGKTALDFMFQEGSKAGLIDEFFVNTLAYSYFSDMNAPIIYAILEKSIELFPRSAQAHQTLAEVYYAAGKKDRAIPYFRKALQLDPGNSNILRKLGESNDKN